MAMSKGGGGRQYGHESEGEGCSMAMSQVGWGGIAISQR